MHAGQSQKKKENHSKGESESFIAGGTSEGRKIKQIDKGKKNNKGEGKRERPRIARGPSTRKKASPKTRSNERGESFRNGK